MTLTHAPKGAALTFDRQRFHGRPRSRHSIGRSLSSGARRCHSSCRGVCRFFVPWSAAGSHLRVVTCGTIATIAKLRLSRHRGTRRSTRSRAGRRIGRVRVGIGISIVRVGIGVGCIGIGIVPAPPCRAAKAEVKEGAPAIVIVPESPVTSIAKAAAVPAAAAMPATSTPIRKCGRGERHRRYQRGCHQHSKLCHVPSPTSAGCPL